MKYSLSPCLRLHLACAVMAAAVPLQSLAAVSQEEARQLGWEGTPLTPVGAERAGNESGTIPAWEGGLTTAPEGHVAGSWLDVDPFADDPILFTITAENYEQYKDMLTDGQIHLLTTYPDYRMHVYPTRRSASAPREFLERTMQNATQARLCPDRERCLEGFVDGGGFPFPIPTHGPIPSGAEGDKMAYEIIWNTYVRYSGDAVVSPHTNIYIVNADGRHLPTFIDDVQLFPYAIPKARRSDSVIFRPSGRGEYNNCLSFTTIHPPRTAGTILAGCAATGDATLQLYLYLPGQRRVRKAPELGLHDAPGGNTDGVRMIDQFQGYFPSGTDERYDFQVVGKRELLIPYNSYKLAHSTLKAKEFLRAKHPNQEYVRYELHRVWELEGTLRPGMRHLSPRRKVYIDEDGWLAGWSDVWNQRGELWRAVALYPVVYYDIPVHKPWGQVFFDFLTERYVTSNAWFNLSDTAVMPTVYGPTDWSKEEINFDLFTPQGIRQRGLR